jgi:GNAT superfamily N-acetyltransferase
MAHLPSADAAIARFHAATATHLTGALDDRVTLSSTDVATWDHHNQALWDQSSDRAPPYDLRLVLTDDERTHAADLEAVMPAPLAHRILLHAGDQVIGAYWGQQETWSRYYMVFSVVRHDWQGRGVYSALLRRVMAAATDAGFREIYSRHRADNNAILVPKLRAGFSIAAMEITPRFGLLVHLRRYTSAGLRQLAEHRIDGSHAAELRARGLPIP